MNTQTWYSPPHYIYSQGLQVLGKHVSLMVVNRDLPPCITFMTKSNVISKLELPLCHIVIDMREPHGNNLTLSVLILISLNLEVIEFIISYFRSSFIAWLHSQIINDKNGKLWDNAIVKMCVIHLLFEHKRTSNVINILLIWKDV